MIAELRYFENETIFDSYFTVDVLPIDANSLEGLYGAIRAVQEVARTTTERGTVRVLDSSFHSDFLPKVERALWVRVRELKEAEAAWVRMYVASQTARLGPEWARSCGL
jgi:hypothetical protein